MRIALPRGHGGTEYTESFVRRCFYLRKKTKVFFRVTPWRWDLECHGDQPPLQQVRTAATK